MPLWLILFGIILITNRLALAQNDRAVERGLSYLIKTQNKDGSFGPAKNRDQQIITTSVSLLAFVSAGHAPDLGKFGSAVRAATDHLIHLSQTKMSEAAHAAYFAALGEVAGIDDSPQDQIQLSGLLGSEMGNVKIIPFNGVIMGAGKTILALRSADQTQMPASLSYSILYRAAVFSSYFHAEVLSERIDAFLLARQRADGAWDDAPEPTAYAVLALTAGEHLMSLTP